MTPTKGSVALLKLGPAAGTAATVAGINWTLNVDATLKDISNFVDGRLPTPTLENSDLSFTLVWDQSAQPHLVAGSGVDAGLVIDVKLFVDATKFYSGSFVVATVGPNISSMEDVLMYPVTAKIKGTLLRPT